MNRWFEHKDVFYNLDHFCQICLGDDDEIVLSAELHNGVWENENAYCSLLFKNKEERDLVFKKIKKILIKE